MHSQSHDKIKDKHKIIVYDALKIPSFAQYVLKCEFQ